MTSRDALDAARPDPPRLRGVLAQAGAQGCYLYSLDPVTAGNHAHARFFNRTVGIAEDPATGSAAGPLAAHLVRQSCVSGQSPIRIEQGHQLGRPSVLGIEVTAAGVRIGGRCAVSATGTLHC